MLAIYGFLKISRSLEQGQLKFSTANDLWYSKKVRPVYQVAIGFAVKRAERKKLNLYLENIS